MIMDVLIKTSTVGGRRIRFFHESDAAVRRDDTLMIGNGIDLKTVKEICGHKDISTTMNYAHVLEENLKNVAKSFSITPKLRLIETQIALGWG